MKLQSLSALILFVATMATQAAAAAFPGVDESVCEITCTCKCCLTCPDSCNFVCPPTVCRRLSSFLQSALTYIIGHASQT